MTTQSSVSAHNPWSQQNATIESVTPESAGVATYDIAICNATIASEYRFQPGQFNMLYLPGVGEAAISLSGDPHQHGSLRHTIRSAGSVTGALAALGPGGHIGLRGPFGSHWPLSECQGRDVILVAGGIGMAPLRPLVCALLADRASFGNISLLLGARTSAGLLFASEWDQWRNGMEVHCTVDRATAEWQGHVGVVTTLLERLPIDRPDNTVLLTCGPEVMMWYSIRSALARGLSERSVWLSLERNMNCAVGFCGHCQLGPAFICKDGPIIRWDCIAPYLKTKSL